MKRRFFLEQNTLFVAALSIGSTSLLLQSCRDNKSQPFNSLFDSNQVDLINEIGNVIIPPTDVPGAKEAKVGEFIALILQDCYPKTIQDTFKESLKDVNDATNEKYQKDFIECSQDEKQEAIAVLFKNPDKYKLLIQIVVYAYLTSGIGRTEFLEYYQVPGRYDGCINTGPTDWMKNYHFWV